METLTLASLRSLARLYRAEVDGAAEMLAAIIADRAEELPAVLGVPAQNLPRLHAAENPIAMLVATIEAAPAVARARREETQLEHAAELALRLAQTAVPRRDGHLGLDPALLAETLACFPGRVITFGERGSCGAARLRGLIRELRHLAEVTVVVTADRVQVVYAGAAVRGMVKLVLHAPVLDASALVIPLDRAGVRRPQEVEHAAFAQDSCPTGPSPCPQHGPGRVGTAGEPSTAPKTPQGQPVRRTDHRRGWGYVVEALLAAVVGAMR